MPSSKETTAIAFQFNPPDACAPQSVLLAVPPVPDQPWTVASLHRVLARNARPREAARGRRRGARRDRPLHAGAVLRLQHQRRSRLDRLRAADEIAHGQTTSRRPDRSRRSRPAGSGRSARIRAAATGASAAAAAAAPAAGGRESVDHELDASRSALAPGRHAREPERARVRSAVADGAAVAGRRVPGRGRRHAGARARALADDDAVAHPSRRAAGEHDHAGRRVRSAADAARGDGRAPADCGPRTPATRACCG